MAGQSQKIVEGLKAFGEEWEGLKAAPEFKSLESGEYRCRVDSKESGAWIAKTNKLGFKVCFVVVDGEFADRRIYRDLWLRGTTQDPVDEKAKEMAKRDMLKLGLIPRDL